MDTTTAAQPSSAINEDADVHSLIHSRSTGDDMLAALRKELAVQKSVHGFTGAMLGSWGERYARAWLEHHGWLWLCSNWRTRYGELDLVMLDPRRVMVFVEVKTRRSTMYGTPQEAVNAHKRLTLRRAGVQWLLEPSHRIAHTGVRFDVIAISVIRDEPHIVHIEEAF